MAAVDAPHPAQSAAARAPRRPVNGTTTHRSLPHNLDAEAGILGGIMLENSTLAELDTLEAEDFYDHRHKTVWQAIRNLEARGAPMDVVTVEAEIEKLGKLDAIGGIAYLAELQARTPIAMNVIAYAKTVRDLHTLRRLALTVSNALERSYEWQWPVDELLGETITDLQRLEKNHRETSEAIPFISPGRALEELDRLAALPIYDTPFATLNTALGTGGFLGTQYYSVSAHTGVGKTSWVAKIANHVAITRDVIVATWEMLAGYFLARIAAPVLRVHSNAIIRGEIAGGRVLNTISSGVTFLEEPSLHMLRRAAEHLTKKRGTPPLIIVDYLQLLGEQLAREMPRPDTKIAVALASSALRAIAKEVGSPLLAVSATSRSTGKELAQDVRRKAPVELVGAGRDSGTIEYDGAGVIVLSISDELDLDGQVATMTVAKSRFGEKMHIDARFDGRSGDWIDCGRVERTPQKSKTDSATPEKKGTADMRARIERSLRSAGAVESKNKLHKLVGGNKAVCLAELDAMVDAKLVRITAFGFAMADAPSQTSIHEVVPGGEP